MSHLDRLLDLRTIVLDPDSGGISIVGDLVVPVCKLSRRGGIVKYRVMIVLHVVKIVTEVVLEHNGRRTVARRPVLVVYSLWVTLVDIGVIPEWKGRVWWYEIRRLGGLGTVGWQTLIREFVGASVEAQDLGDACQTVCNVAMWDGTHAIGGDKDIRRGAIENIHVKWQSQPIIPVILRELRAIDRAHKSRRGG